MSETTEIKFNSVDELDRDAADALVRFVMCFADTKHMMGRRLSEWVTAAPAMEAAVAAANLTQEELGHARSLFAMIRDLPGAPAELNTETDLSRTEYFSPSFLEHSFARWTDVIATLFLLDHALTTVIKTASESSLKPLKQRVAKILQEEQFHRMFADGWAMRLAHENAAMKEFFQKSLSRSWGAAEAWFGPESDQAFAPLVENGILAKFPAQCADDWRQSVRKTLLQNGLEQPTLTIDWQNWQSERREIVTAE